jgi:hypothetical protein
MIMMIVMVITMVATMMFVMIIVRTVIVSLSVRSFWRVRAALHSTALSTSTRHPRVCFALRVEVKGLCGSAGCAYLVDQTCVVPLLAHNDSDLDRVFGVSHANDGLCEIQITYGISVKY